jgi:PqqD family protein of HPr-rel-A system
MNPLPRVRPGLLRHQLDDQVLVYDSREDRVHLLDPTTACVLTLLQEGGWTPEGIAAELSARIGMTSGAAFLPLALDELRGAGLLESEIDPPVVDVSRRDMMRKVAMASAAALLVPAIVTFTATPGYAAGSGAGNLGLCAHCTSDADCAAPNLCGTDATSRACGSNKTANGGACSGGNQTSANNQCCSGTCSSTNGICLA